MRLLSLIFTLCLSTITLADLPALKVLGPVEAEPGQLIVLTAESDGTNFLWIPDASLGQVLQCNPKQIGMATPKVGVHKIVVVASNDKGEMAFTTHAITIKPFTPVEPDPKPDPVTPVPPSDFAEFKEVASKAVATLKDPQTTLQLKNNLSRLYPDLLKMTSVAEAKKSVTRVIENTLLLRTGTSKDVPWISGLRTPLDELQKKYNFTDVTKYAASIKAVIDGLDSKPASNVLIVPVCPTCPTPLTLK